MAEHLRRHTAQLSDADVTLLLRAMKAYALVMEIQTSAGLGSQLRREADDNARLASIVQAHTRCQCPTPPT